MENQEYLTVTEASRLLRISKAQAYIMIQKKEIPFIRVTEKRVIIPKKELEKWIQQRLIVK